MFRSAARVSATVAALMALPATAAIATPVESQSASVPAATSGTGAGAVDMNECMTVLMQAQPGQLTANMAISNVAVHREATSTMTFGGRSVQPRLMASLGMHYDGVALAILPDGSLWSVVAALDTGTTTTKQIRSAGFSSVRAMGGNGHGQVYMTWASGKLSRYNATATTIGGTKVLATSGWSGILSLNPSGQGKYGSRAVDSFLALTKTGGLNEYSFASDGWKKGDVLRATGWGGMAVAMAGTCDDEFSLGRAIYGVTKTGDVYGYTDARAADHSGADIRGAGRMTPSLPGLVF